MGKVFKIIIDPNHKERMMDGYYLCKFHCSNCGRPNSMYDGVIDVIIPMGQMIPENELICPNCGCETLKA